MKKTKNISIFCFAILLLQIGCLSSLQFEPRNEDPKFLLVQEYMVRLDATWTTKQAERLLKIFKSISLDHTTQSSVWNISNDYLLQDIQIETQIGLKSVTVSSDVFVVDASQSTSLADKRFFMAVVQFITENGTNRSMIKRILHERYGINVDITSDVKNSVLLPAYATQNITPQSFTEIDNEVLMIFISILEDFPKALHKIPSLKYIVCRDEDLGGAAAKAWTSSGFIEFRKSVLDKKPVSDIRKTLAHEKSHFLWDHLLTSQLKNDWFELGGWYQDLQSKHGWSTNRKREEFVTDYAFQMNPNEDMAETLSFYLVCPDKLQACNMAKYNFIHERIMLTYGKRYISPNMLSGK